MLVASLLLSQYLHGTISDDFIGVHVGVGPRTSLDHVHDKLNVQGPHADFVTGLHYRILDFAGYQAQIEGRQTSEFLHHRQGVDEIGVKVHPDATNIEILQGPQRLHSIIRLGRYFFVTQKRCSRTSTELKKINSDCLMKYSRLYPIPKVQQAKRQARTSEISIRLSSLTNPQIMPQI